MMPHLPRFYVYLLLSDRGEIYTGYTANLRRRFRQHNAKNNRGYTRGRRWHLLAVRCFLDGDTALLFEERLKAWRPWWRRNYEKDAWLRRVRPRIRTLCERHGIRCPHTR